VARFDRLFLANGWAGHDGSVPRPILGATKTPRRVSGYSGSRRTRSKGFSGEAARRCHLAAVERTDDAPARRIRLERALVVTEAQARSVQDNIAHLMMFRRTLQRYIRVLRHVIAAESHAGG
jgi:hypothetical protein